METMPQAVLEALNLALARSAQEIAADVLSADANVAPI